jgi:hypothetical protein
MVEAVTRDDGMTPVQQAMARLDPILDSLLVQQMKLLFMQSAEDYERDHPKSTESDYQRYQGVFKQKREQFNALYKDRQTARQLFETFSGACSFEAQVDRFCSAVYLYDAAPLKQKEAFAQALNIVLGDALAEPATGADLKVVAKDFLPAAIAKKYPHAAGQYDPFHPLQPFVNDLMHQMGDRYPDNSTGSFEHRIGKWADEVFAALTDGSAAATDKNREVACLAINTVLGQQLEPKFTVQDFYDKEKAIATLSAAIHQKWAKAGPPLDHFFSSYSLPVDHA